MRFAFKWVSDGMARPLRNVRLRDELMQLREAAKLRGTMVFRETSTGWRKAARSRAPAVQSVGHRAAKQFGC